MPRWLDWEETAGPQSASFATPVSVLSEDLFLSCSHFFDTHCTINRCCIRVACLHTHPNSLLCQEVRTRSFNDNAPLPPWMHILPPPCTSRVCFARLHLAPGPPERPRRRVTLSPVQVGKPRQRKRGQLTCSMRLNPHALGTRMYGHHDYLAGEIPGPR